MVVPLQVLNQWRKEIASHTRLRVLVNHGSTRAASAAEFGDYDIVLTTYDIVLCDYKSGTDMIKSSRGKGKPLERAEQVTAKKRSFVSSGDRERAGSLLIVATPARLSLPSRCL